MLTSNDTKYVSSTIKKHKSRILPKKCRICGASAEYFSFGVITCNPCKMFFKRNADAKKSIGKCDFDGHCKINVNTRHVCTSCRLIKCFQYGMTTDKFRASRQPKIKINFPKKTKLNTLIQIQTKSQPERLPTLNLLQSDKSLLTSNQWTLLSNLTNIYRESKLLSISQRLIDTHNILQSTNIIYKKLVDEFLSTIYETTGTYLRLNGDICNLSSNDRSIMLRNAADNVSCIGGEFIMHHCHLLTFDVFSNIVELLYGKRSVDIHLWAMKFIDPDIILVKLAISLFAFSENIYSCSPYSLKELTNPLNILKIQNKYAEITWKYLIYRYGHYEAVGRYVKLISWLDAITIFMFHAQSLALHVNDVDSLVEQIELTLILDDIDEIIQENT